MGKGNMRVSFAPTPRPSKQTSREEKGMEKCNVSDPDWTRIQLGQWVRNRIRNPDPDPGEQKRPNKSTEITCFEVPDVL
jgi:hypothetical protein